MRYVILKKTGDTWVIWLDADTREAAKAEYESIVKLLTNNQHAAGEVMLADLSPIESFKAGGN